MKTSKELLLDVVIERDKDGYFVYCPSLQGCCSQGETYEDAVRDIRDAIKLHIEDRLAAKERIPSAESISVTSLAVPLRARASLACRPTIRRARRGGG